MKKMNDIICITMTSWEGNYLKSTVELMKELSARNTVWYFDYQYTLKDFFKGLLLNDKTIPWKKMAGIERRTTEVKPYPGGKVIIYTPPPIIPAFWIKRFGLFKLINRLNHFLAIRPFKKFLNKKQVNPKAIITALNPFMGLGVKKYFGSKPHVYYCFDEIRAAHWLKTFGGQAEDMLLPGVDAAVFTSDYLQKIKGEKVARSAVIKNGVHYDAFAQHKRKFDTNAIPVVGYLGSIDDRFDIDMMERVIQKLPNIEFHMVGRVVYEEVPKRLKQYANVKFFPPVNANDVPPIMGKMDIGIIPYLKNDFTAAVYPLKVNEYLSVGLPVIMTSFASLPDFNDVADLADDAETFINCIRKNLADDSPEKINERMKFASANSWRQRAEDLEKFVLSV
jgi:teichuronic acid biosynthesis glycosyltransferase TuaH